jgi:hypothetical protein
MIAYITRLERTLFGDSLFAIRLFPALAGAAMIGMTGLLVLEFGGGTFALVLACTSFLIAPLFLHANGFLNIVTFDQFYWLCSAFLVVKLAQKETPQRWLLLGVCIGLGLMTKHTMLFFGFGLTVGLLLTDKRKWFLTKWPWIAAAIALFIFHFNIVWQIHNGWPTLEFLRNLNRYNMSRISPPEFLLGQVLYLHPLTFPVWLAGLWFFLFSAAGRPYRALGWVYISVFLLLVTVKSKIYYLGPTYPMLFAGGACAIDTFSRTRVGRVPKAVLIAVMVCGGAVLAPLSLPILPLEDFKQYVAVFAKAVPNAYEVVNDFKDMIGWEEEVAAVAKVYESLPEEERKECAIFCGNYSHAGAVDLFGPRYHLPKAISGHLSYYLWGPHGASGKVLITLGIPQEDLKRYFDQVELKTVVHRGGIGPGDPAADVCLARDPKISLTEAWEKVKHY